MYFVNSAVAGNSERSGSGYVYNDLYCTEDDIDLRADFSAFGAVSGDYGIDNSCITGQPMFDGEELSDGWFTTDIRITGKRLSVITLANAFRNSESTNVYLLPTTYTQSTYTAYYYAAYDKDGDMRLVDGSDDIGASRYEENQVTTDICGSSRLGGNVIGACVD